MGLSKFLDINFYVLMGVVLGILYFHHAKEFKKNSSMKMDKKILKILIVVYIILTLISLFLTIKF